MSSFSLPCDSCLQIVQRINLDNMSQNSNYKRKIQVLHLVYIKEIIIFSIFWLLYEVLNYLIIMLLISIWKFYSGIQMLFSYWYFGNSLYHIYFQESVFSYVMCKSHELPALSLAPGFSDRRIWIYMCKWPVIIVIRREYALLIFTDDKSAHCFSLEGADLLIAVNRLYWNLILYGMCFLFCIYLWYMDSHFFCQVF